MKPFMLLALTVAAFPFLVTSCASSEIGDSKDVNQETIYQQYHVAYSETADKVTLTAQFRFAGEDGTTLVLSNPASIQFDQKQIKADSSDGTGAFYETSLEANSFFGKHQFVYTDTSGKQFSNGFSFKAVKLDLPATAYKTQPLKIFFDGLPEAAEYYLEINSENTDSSFTINHSYNDSVAYAEVPANELRRQPGNDLKLHVSLAVKIPLQNATREGGMMIVEYNFKPVTIHLVQDIPIAVLKTLQPADIICAEKLIQ